MGVMQNGDRENGELSPEVGSGFELIAWCHVSRQANTRWQFRERFQLSFEKKLSSNYI